MIGKIKYGKLNNKQNIICAFRKECDKIWKK